MRIFWLCLGIVSVVSGIIGIFLPLLPTVPFLLLAAFSFSRSSQRLHQWLITHPRLGPPIVDWEQSGAIRRRIKIMATLSIGAVFLISIAVQVPGYVLVIQALVLGCVLTFIWSRPES